MILRWEDKKKEYAPLKRYLAGELSFSEAYKHSSILRRIVLRIIINEQLNNDRAYGIRQLYNPYSSMKLLRRLEEDGLVKIIKHPLNAGTTKIIARPTARLKELLKRLEGNADRYPTAI